MKEQLQENLKGFTGNLDQLVPDLIVKDDIYGKDRLTTKIKNKDVGAVGVSPATGRRNSCGGIVKHKVIGAMVTSGQRFSPAMKQHLKKLEAYVDKILSTQDADGYLGIYDTEMRYRFENENGELWSKASLLARIAGVV